MNRDVLREAAIALRGEALASEGDAQVTRLRIVATVRKRQEKRVFAFRAAVLLVAAVVGSTAWAAATGRLPGFRVLSPLVERAASDQAAPVARATPVAEPSAPSAVAAAPATAAEETPPPGEDPPAGALVRPRSVLSEPKRTSAPEPASQPESRRAATETAPATPVDPDAASHTLYTRAHGLHFQSRDYAAARSAWEAYLAAAPHGRFAVEAHYNRAICLVRLGKNGEAKQALRPFAEGPVGGYRRAEARSLIEAMDAARP